MAALGTIVSTSDLKSTATQTPTSGATMALTITGGQNTVVSYTAAGNNTINLTYNSPAIGDELTFIILNDGVVFRVITFGTNLTSVGIATGVLSKTSVIKFVSNGTLFIEVSRTIGI